jgi:asparagine synthase (glutamine-hydrolysing)
MCGIAGIKFFSDPPATFDSQLKKATAELKKRGPDSSGIYFDDKVGLGHSRLSIIDTSEAAFQPFSDPLGRYTIVFNGEIFNYKELREKYLSEIKFKSESDTEVLLNLFILMGKDCLELLNGFFAFSIYDKQAKSLFLARDRFGVKPLYYYSDNLKFCFASELKSILQFGLKKEIDFESLSMYFHLNYIPSPYTIYKDIFKLNPGYCVTINSFGIVKHSFYHPQINYRNQEIYGDYAKAKLALKELLEDSVKKRLVADVPLGSFLSGGIDSSVVAALASKHLKNLNTFSIGFKDEPFFDETRYAQMVAKKHHTNHTVFSLSNDNLFEHFYDFLDCLDEPFADSSALAVYILSKETRKKVTVALSGDGADEIFSGYNKHSALFKSINKSFAESFLKHLEPGFRFLPKSRNNKMGNTFRKLHKFSIGLGLSTSERYWRWAGFSDSNSLQTRLKEKINTQEYIRRKLGYLKHLDHESDFNKFLLADVELVLQGDMLPKVDLMSMANSLEVRTPFLDYRVVDFAFSIPAEFKIDKKRRKKILIDSFSDLLPSEVLNRPKKGFEIPLLGWFKKELKPIIENELLSEDFINQQNIFNYREILELKKQLFSPNPDDSTAQIWALLVFQYWWKNFHNS